VATSTAALANLALRYLGDSTRLLDLTTETTAAAKVCNEFLPRAITETLRAYAWRFARIQAELTLVETVDTTDTRLEWLYGFRLPEDCLQPLRLLNGWINAPLEYQIPFETRKSSADAEWDSGTTYDLGDYAKVTAGPVITWYRALVTSVALAPASNPTEWASITGVPPLLVYCNFDTALLEYTQAVSDVRAFPDDFDNAVAARLAYYIAPIITKGSNDLGDKAAQSWQFLIGQAEAVDANAQQRHPEPMSSFEAERHTGFRG